MNKDQYDITISKIKYWYNIGILNAYEKGVLDRYFKTLFQQGRPELVNDSQKIKKLIDRLEREVEWGVLPL